MNPGQAFFMALRALTASKMRSALTVLGIVIGVGAVIGLMSMGRGVQGYITSQIQGMGTNLLMVQPGAPSVGGVRAASGSAATLTVEDADAIRAGVPTAALVAPLGRTFAQVVVGGLNFNTQIMGVTPEYQDVRNYQVAHGEFISQQNITARSRVAVLGSQTALNLFPDGDPVGQWITVSRQRGRQRVQVIGVLESKGGGAVGAQQDDVVMLPLSTLQTRFSVGLTARGEKRVDLINIQVTDKQDMEVARQQIADVLRERHHIMGEDDFTIVSQDDILKTMNQVTGVMTLFLGSIAGISLLVGGIGIMNIMLVSVTERIREIGIRKAVGARRRDILMQFLMESVVLSFSGGLLGFLMGWSMSRILSQISMMGQPIRTEVTPDIIALALSVALGIGLFFGIYPASRAARLDPIEALRHE